MSDDTRDEAAAPAQGDGPATPEDRSSADKPASNDAAKPKQDDGSKQAPQSDAPRKSSDRRSGRPRRTAVVRYGLMRNIGEFRHNLDEPPARGRQVVVRTERGVELGVVVSPVCDCDSPCAIEPGKLGAFLKSNGRDYPFRRDGRVLRLANHQDVIDYRHLDTSAHEAATFCRQQIKELKLDMRLVTVEHLLGGERIVFYFSAEQRVDFRELVRRLATEYRTRIEMRQVGARDEARLVADYERCGQQCCCQSFLKDLKPVSMRMAKTQKATLDPSKISGRCGRLMCCLRYEDETYEDLRKRLPRRNTWVRTEDTVGRVVETQIITQLVRLQVPDGTRVAVGVEDIVERNVEPPKPPQASNGRDDRRRGRGGRDDRKGDRGKDRGEQSGKGDGEAEAKPEAAPLNADGQDDSQGSGQQGGDGGDGGDRSGGRKKKRRRRSRKGKSGEGQQPKGSGDGRGGGSSGDGDGGSGGGKRKKRRPRRRRKKGPKKDN